MQIRANIAIVEERQVWQRNEEFKHWGEFKIFKFAKGQPKYLIASYSSLALLLFFLIAFPLLALLHNYRQAINLRTLAVLLTPLQAYTCYLFYTTNPGIASHSLPIINELDMLRFKNFCGKCKCMQGETIRHCQHCDVCIEKAHVHSNVLNTCITPMNISAFAALWLTILAQSLLCIAT